MDLPAAIERAKGIPGTFTQAVGHNMASGYGCVLCGQEVEEEYAAIVLFSDGKMVGDVCPTCAAAGPHGAAIRMREWVKKWNRQIYAQIELAGEVEQVQRWATVEELREAERAAREAMGDSKPEAPDAGIDTMDGAVPDTATPF